MRTRSACRLAQSASFVRSRRIQPGSLFPAWHSKTCLPACLKTVCGEGARSHSLRRSSQGERRHATSSAAGLRTVPRARSHCAWPLGSPGSTESRAGWRGRPATALKSRQGSFDSSVPLNDTLGDTYAPHATADGVINQRATAPLTTPENVNNVKNLHSRTKAM